MDSVAAIPPATDSKQTGAQPTLVRGLGLLDSVLLLESGIIGSSIFLTAKDIAAPLPHPAWFLMVWVLGGLISLCACCAFAELGSMFPDSGGQYVYLREAYGDLVAFLYGWMLFSVANGGRIASLAGTHSPDRRRSRCHSRTHPRADPHRRNDRDERDRLAPRCDFTKCRDLGEVCRDGGIRDPRTRRR